MLINDAATRGNMNLLEQDRVHRQLALDSRKSFIVQAPAGSGKTELLIQRFLVLLSQVKMPEEILAITFTKKAANEMRSRVIKALKTALHDREPESAHAHAKQTWMLAKKVLQQDKSQGWHLIDNPNQLRIQTIDSLCSHLTRQLPLLSRFGSQPDISDHPVALYREAVQEVLMHVEEDNEWSLSLTKLLLHLDNDLNKLHELLVNLLSKRDQWLSYIQLATNDNDLRNQLENQLKLIITDTLSEIKRLFPKELSAEVLAVARFASAHSKVIEPLTALPGDSFRDKNAWTGLARLLLTKSFSWRKRVDEDIGFPPLKNIENANELAIHRGFRERLTVALTKLSDNEHLRSALEELFFLPDPEYTDSQWEILQSLLHILKLTAAQLRITFQQHGQIDFIENTQAALSALGNDEEPTDLALALDYHIQHILIDEFQDTSYSQYQLLEKLTYGWEENDGRSLFVVGDPMQSIYRFREAEVGLFIRMRSKGLQNIKLIPLTLAVNFRSTANIVEWNNTHFSKLFPSFDDMASGAVSYSPSVSNDAQITDEKTIMVQGFVNASLEAESEQIVKLILEAKQHSPDDKIAILVRSRPHLVKIIPALKKANIAYRAIEIDSLASRQCIQDVLSLTCALLHPADRISWLSVLRAPWCGLMLADLLVIAGNDPYTAIYSQLQSTEILGKLSEDGRLRITKIFPVLKSGIASRERMNLRTYIEQMWILLGGPACLNDEAELDDVNAFLELLDEFGEKNQSLNLDKLKEKMNQLYASTKHLDASVQIMTIHTAKGLEFDTVILPQLHRKNPSDDKSLMLWMEQPLLNEQVALLLAPIHATGTEKDALYEYIHRQQRSKSDYEMSRLFYVAATRARKKLHLLFHASCNEKNEIRVESGSFLAKIWPLWEKKKADILNFMNQELNADIMVPVSRPVKRVKSSWVNPVSEIISPQVALHQQSAGFLLPDNTARLIGTITHRILQIISESSTAFWLSKSDDEINNYLLSLLKQFNISVEKHEFATNAILTGIKNTLADERGKWILHKHANAKSEFAITALIENELENLVIDRTFVDENNTLWIIDYKTSSFSPEDNTNFLIKEQKKYTEQMQKYRDALSFQHTGPIRMGLYFPALPAWCEWA